LPRKPWKSFAAVEPGGEYLMLLSSLPLKNWRGMPLFLLGTLRITFQLRHAEGLIGYSLLARPLRKQFFTLSVWQNETALNGFVYARPHFATMNNLTTHMGQTRFVRRSIKGSEVPPSWAYALSL